MTSCSDLSSSLVMGYRRYVCQWSVVVLHIKQSHLEHWSQDSQHGIVDFIDRNSAIGDRISERLTKERVVGHLLIQSLIDGDGVSSSPIGHNPPIELKIRFQSLIQSIRVFTTPNTIDFVV